MKTSHDEITINSDGEKEPYSIKQLNISISDNLNKVQEMQNEIQAKNNIIENKINQIKDDDNFLREVEEEKFMYIERVISFDGITCKG